MFLLDRAKLKFSDESCTELEEVFSFLNKKYNFIIW